MVQGSMLADVVAVIGESLESQEYLTFSGSDLKCKTAPTFQ